MQRTLLIAAGLGLALAALPRAAHAEGGPFGIGLILGSPTGISGKYYLGDSGHAIDFAVGGAVATDNGLHVHADFLWHPWILAREPSFNLPVHLGVGARVLDHDRGNKGDNDFHFGLRAPIGLTFDFTEVPLDAFVEIALIFDVHTAHDNNFGIDLNAGVGVRYYF
jgi:hypothetical protein